MNTEFSPMERALLVSTELTWSTELDMEHGALLVSAELIDKRGAWIESGAVPEHGARTTSALLGR